jgi:dTDP-4-dehydrorhamnose reductase
MRALVIGASGQVGAALAARLVALHHEVVGTHRGVAGPATRFLDLADHAATARLIEETAADWVFCPAGLTHVDWCEDHAAEAMAANRDAPAAAARAAVERGAGFVYFSTEYVFDGAGGPYGEDDRVNPLSVYGRSKLEGERAALAANPRTLVVRTTVVYGPEPQGKNFVYQLLHRARRGEPMRVPTDQRSSPTYNPDLAAATVELAERGVTGVVHVAGPEVVDRHAFARLACEVFDLDPGFLEPVTTAGLRQRAARPLDAGLRTDRVRALVTVPLRRPKDGLAAMRAALEGRVVDTPRAAR